MIDIRVPALGESISEALVARWNVKDNDFVEQDQLLLELETDKVTMEVTAPARGRVTGIQAKVNAYVKVGDILAQIDDKANQDAHTTPPIPTPAPQVTPPQPVMAPAEPRTVSQPRPPIADIAPVATSDKLPTLSPSVRRLIEEHNLNPDDIVATGPRKNLTKGDVLSYIERRGSQVAQPQQTQSVETQTTTVGDSPRVVPQLQTTTVTERPQLQPQASGARSQARKPLSRLRQTIAERLKHAQNTAAILTTFNEVDMTPVMAIRAQYQEEFTRINGIKLGFMPFFVRACVSALTKYPEINAQIDGQDIVYHDYCDIGVAVGTDQGLIVPILRDAQNLSFVDIEMKIADFAERAKSGKLKPDELLGGTFTISNGGVYGSLLSTPILNPPQSGILGMHKIQKRPVVTDDDQIVIRQMMYLALSYDHRIIDGKGAVSFLVHVKSMLENPERLLLGL